VAGPWLRRKANRALLDEITANLYFLVSEPQASVPRSIGVLQSEWQDAGRLVLSNFHRRRKGALSIVGALDPTHSRFRFGKLVLIIPSRFGCCLEPCGYCDFDDD
jgi:hypothetical protein